MNEREPTNTIVPTFPCLTNPYLYSKIDKYIPQVNYFINKKLGDKIYFIQNSYETYLDEQFIKSLGINKKTVSFEKNSEIECKIKSKKRK
jgi:hypothetical protein